MQVRFQYYKDRPISVWAVWDRERQIWTAESPDLPQLVAESKSLVVLNKTLGEMIETLNFHELPCANKSVQ